MKRRSSQSSGDSPYYVFKKGNWTVEEDELIKSEVMKGNFKWSDIAKKLEQNRTGKQCRERWANHLNPELKKSPWTEEEDEALIAAQAVMGNAWTRIAKTLEGRSENEVKNRWYSALTKRPKLKAGPRSTHRRGGPSTSTPLTTEESLPLPHSPPLPYELLLLRGDSSGESTSEGDYDLPLSRSTPCPPPPTLLFSHSSSPPLSRENSWPEVDFHDLSQSIDALFEENAIGVLRGTEEERGCIALAETYLQALSPAHPQQHPHPPLHLMNLRQDLMSRGGGGGGGSAPSLSLHYPLPPSSGPAVHMAPLSPLPTGPNFPSPHFPSPYYTPQPSSAAPRPCGMDELSMASFLLESQARGEGGGVDSLHSSLSSSPFPLTTRGIETSELSLSGEQSQRSLSPGWLEEMRRMLSSAPPSPKS